MTEWYVYMEWGRPLEVILGRRLALDRLIGKRESARKSLRWMTERMPDLGAHVTLGATDLEGNAERCIVRVIGPGTEV